MHHPQLEQCSLFQGLTPEEQAYALSYFDAKTKTYEKGEFLHHVSFPLERFGLVLSGTVQVYMDDMDGHHIIMNSVGAGALWGGLLLLGDRRSHLHLRRHGIGNPLDESQRSKRRCHHFVPWTGPCPTASFPPWPPEHCT